LFKKGIEYVVHSHNTKADKSLFIVKQLKQAAYASEDVVVQSKEPKQEISKVNYKQKDMLEGSKIEHQQLQQDKLSFVSAMKGKQGMVTAMSILSMLLMGLLLFSGAWILAANMNVDAGEKGLDIFYSLCVLLTIAWMSKVYRFRIGWKDTG